MVQIFIPAPLRRLTAGQAQVAVVATTLREAIEALEQQCPGIRGELCENDGLAPTLQVAVDNRMTRRMSTPLKADSEIHFLPAIGGG